MHISFFLHSSFFYITHEEFENRTCIFHVLLTRLMWEEILLSRLFKSRTNKFSNLQLQSNPAFSNSVNSKSPLFRRKIEFPWIFPSPLSFPGYLEIPLFRTFVHFPWDFEIAGFDCNNIMAASILNRCIKALGPASKVQTFQHNLKISWSLSVYKCFFKLSYVRIFIC